MRASLILLLWAPVACSAPSENPTAKNEQLVRSMFEAFNRHDWEAMASHYSDSALFLDPSFGTDYVWQTRTEMVIKYKEMHALFPDLHDEVVTVTANDNRVAVEFISTGTQPDGKQFELPIGCVLTLEAGKIVKDATYYNNCPLR